MDMASSKKRFREGVTGVVAPVLIDHGFREWKPSGRDDAPILHFERCVADSRDLIDIQFDKHGRSKCFVNLARIRGETVETMFEGFLPVESVTIAHLRERTRLKGNSMCGAFTPPLLMRWTGKVEQAGRAVGEQIAKHMDDAEQWFETQQPNEHVQNYKL
jgi:hypothetical protein